MTNCLWLVKNGVPLDVALSLPPDEAAAWGIIFGELDGQVWDFTAMKWKDQK